MTRLDGDPPTRSSPFILLKGVFHVMLLNQLWGEHLIGGFPGVVRFWVPLPFDQILEFAPSAMEAMVSNGLDFILLFPIHYLRGRFRKVCSMFFCFAIRRQQAGMEDVMDGPGRRKLELISHWRNSLVDDERTMTFRGQLGGSIREFKVLCLQPDSVAHFVLVRRSLLQRPIERFFGLSSSLGGDF